MTALPDEAYPPFSALARAELDSRMTAKRGAVSNRARDMAIRDGAREVADVHVRLAFEAVEAEVVAGLPAQRPNRFLPKPLLVPLFSTSGAAMIAAAAGWKWASLVLALLLLLVSGLAIRNGGSGN